MDLRPYTPADLDAMVALDDLCFDEPFRFSRSSMRSFAQAKNACALVADADEALAGFCILHVEQSRRKFVGYIVTLDVAPEYRRKGLATKLMLAVERMAADDGCTLLALHVYVANTAAIAFYEHLGFTASHTVEGFYGGELDALLMQKIMKTSAV